MPASISTRLDEEEFLELADYYEVASRHGLTGNTSRTGSTTTTTTGNTRIRRRDTTPPRRMPSTLKEYADSVLASGKENDFHQYDIVEGQTLSHIVIDPRDSLKSPTSMSLESYSDDTRHDDLGKPTVGSVNTLPPRMQINPPVRPSPSFSNHFSRPISTTSLTSGSCFGIIRIPRWKMSGRAGFRPRKQKRVQATQSINLITRDISGPVPIQSFDAGPLGEEYSQGLARASSLLVGLDYDYQLAVEVLVDGSHVGP